MGKQGYFSREAIPGQVIRSWLIAGPLYQEMGESLPERTWLKTPVQKTAWKKRKRRQGSSWNVYASCE